jgi:hypothetical protein
MSAILLFPTIAHAEITKQQIDKFNADYAAVYETCDMNKIKNFVDARFAPNYVASFKDKQGQPQQMRKNQILSAMQETVDFANQMKMKSSNCATQVEVRDMNIRGDMAAIQIAQTEKMTLTAPTGQTIPIAINTLCNHLMTNGPNGVMIKQSECISTQ